MFYLTELAGIGHEQSFKVKDYMQTWCNVFFIIIDGKK